jgi:hypothetical protein
MMERFEKKFIPEPNSGCWLWTAAAKGDGYGHFALNNGKPIGAHRASWMIYNGDIPDGMHVLHRCDVRCCVNPDHLFLGTNQDNVQDRQRKGRRPPTFGEANPKAKLTAIQVAAIRADPRSLSKTAAAYGVSRTHIGLIRQNKFWRI